MKDELKALIEQYRDHHTSVIRNWALGQDGWKEVAPSYPKNSNGLKEGKPEYRGHSAAVVKRDAEICASTESNEVLATRYKLSITSIQRIRRSQA